MYQPLQIPLFDRDQVSDFSCKFEKQVDQLFPIELYEDCQFLFQFNGQLYLSKDGQFCIVKAHESKIELILCIYKLPQWTEIKQIQFNECQQILGCYFTQDNQFVIVETRNMKNYEYIIQNLVQNESKLFTFTDLSMIHFWATTDNKLNLLMNNSGNQLEIHQIDENYNIHLLKCLIPFFNSIHKLMILQGTAFQKKPENIEINYLTNPKNFKYLQFSMHLDQFLFYQRYVQNKTQTNIRHITRRKIIRQVPGFYIDYVCIKNLFIWRNKQRMIIFYDYSRGQTINIVNFKIFLFFLIQGETKQTPLGQMRTKFKKKSSMIRSYQKKKKSTILNIPQLSLQIN